jgi:hypothetical protein
MLPETIIIELKSAESGNIKRIFITSIPGDKNHQTNTQVMQITDVLNSVANLTEKVEVKIILTAPPITLLKIEEAHALMCKPVLDQNGNHKFTKRQKQYCHYSFSKLMTPLEISDKLDLSINRIYQIAIECYVVIGDTNEQKLSGIWLLDNSNWTDPDIYPIP